VSILYRYSYYDVQLCYWIEHALRRENAANDAIRKVCYGK